MNSVIIAKSYKSKVPTFVPGELVVSTITGNILCVTETELQESTVFCGTILYSKTPTHIGQLSRSPKRNFELFDQVLELSNE